MEEISQESLNAYLDRGVELAMQYGPRLILAIVVLLVGLWIVGRILRALRAAMDRSAMEVTLAKFLASLASITLKALLFISVASMVGIETTSFIAILGAAGLAIGLALQGTLANFAGGVLLLIFKPYRVGDFVEAQGVSGTVARIEIFNTVLRTPDNKIVIVPNGGISNGVITNYSMEETRRVDFVFGIGYDDDIPRAKAVLQRLIDAEARVLDTPEPLVVLSELADSSVNFTVRVWVASADYWGVYFALTEQVKLAFDEEGLSIPYPQSDVHVHQAG